MKNFKLRITLIFMIFIFIGGNFYLKDFELLGNNKSGSEVAQNMDESKALYDSLFIEGFNYLTFGNPTMAITSFNNALEISETSDIYAGLGLAYLRKAKGVSENNENNKNRFQELRAAQNINSALKFLKKAVELNADDLDYKYNLAKAYLVRGDFGSLQSALELFEELKDKGSTYTDIDMEMERISKSMEQPGNLTESFRDYMEVGADNLKELYNMTKLLMSQNKIEEASYYYLLALENAANEEELDELFRDVKLLFMVQDNVQFQQMPHKGRYVKGFWRLRDPTPMTPENEHLIEHLRRVAHAEAVFIKSKDRLYDERGDIYIKYGEPEFRYQSAGDSETYPNESWVYPWQVSERGGQLFYDFANRSTGFKIVPDLRYTLIRGGLEYIEWVQLYRDRDWIYPEVYQRLWEKYSTGKVGDIFTLDTELDRIATMKEFNEKDAPPTVFLYDYGGEKMFNILYNYACFKGQGGKTKIEMYYLFPLDGLFFEPDRESNTMNTVVEKAIIVRNIDLECLHFDKSDMKVQIDLTSDLTGRISVGQANFQISPTEIDPVMNLEFKSENSNSVGLYYNDLQLKNFNGSDLMMSDIQFSVDIQPSSVKDQFTKNGLRIIPHVSEFAYKKALLFVYFEIYNLKQNKDGDVRYKVEYIISRKGVESIEEITKTDTLKIKLPESLGKGKNYIAVSEDRTKKEKNTFDYLSFNLSTLSAGRYFFTVRILDKESGASTVSKRNFTLRD